MEQSSTSDYSAYKPCLTFGLPHTGTLPDLFDSTTVDIKKITGLLAIASDAIAGAVEFLETKSTWGSETIAALENLNVSLAPLVSLLIPIHCDALEIVPNPVERFAKYNTYFHITEYRDMDALQLLKTDVALVHSILIEMQLIRMDEQEIVCLLKGVALRLETYRQILGPDAKMDNLPTPNTTVMILSHPLLFDCRISTAFYRWFACHWDFAINLIHARYHFDTAAVYFDKEDYHSAGSEIIKAGVLLRATSADMVFGCSMPAKIYQEFVRPSMGGGFTGNDNPHWSIFAASKKDLLSRQGIKGNKIINAAWGSFLDKYLQDIEVHTTIADKLIGERPSLTIDELNQGIPEEEQDKTPATVGLRNLHYIRLAEFSFLNCYPILYKLFKL